MTIFIVLWPYLLTTKLRCLQKNNIGHTIPPAAPFWFSDSCRFKSGLDFSVERIGTKSPSLIDTEVPELAWLTVLELVENLDENLFKSVSFSVSLIGDDSLVLVDSSFWIESTNSCSPSSEMSSKIRKLGLQHKLFRKINLTKVNRFLSWAWAKLFYFIELSSA